MNQSDLIYQTSVLVQQSRKTVALTGAGISVESGINPFRGKNGLWEKYDPDEYAHVLTFLENPIKSWVMLKEMGEQIFSAHPNPAHVVLTRLQKKGMLDEIITQNVDNMHQDAGSSKVIEFHGNYKHLSCLICGSRYPFDMDRLSAIPPPPLCECGATLKPDVVLFGETPPLEAMKRSQNAVSLCDVLLVIGTSAVIYPAANLPVIAKRQGAKIIEINMEQTHLSSSLSDIFLKGSAGDILSLVEEEIS